MQRPENLRIFSPLTPRGAYLKTFLEKLNPVRIMLEPPSRGNYLIIFLDIIGSTRYFIFLEENFMLVYKVYNFFWKSLDVTLKLKKELFHIKKYDFKLLGDGILIFIPLEEFNNTLGIANSVNFPSREIFIKSEEKRKPIVREQREFITPEALMEKIYKKLNSILKPLNIRVLGGLGSLLKIPYGKDSYEYLGCPISYLVKKSKEVDTYKWFGEITREKCRELLNS